MTGDKELKNQAQRAIRNIQYGSSIAQNTILHLLNRIEQLEKNQVPEGWQAVPVEPTKDMVIAGFESEPSRVFNGDKYPEEYDSMSGCERAAFRAKRCYEDMLAEAPKP